MFECPRCQYNTHKKSNLRNHFNKIKTCLPIFDNISIDQLRIKIDERRAFNLQTQSITLKPQNDNISTQNNSSTQNIKNNKKEYKCNYCNKLSTTSSNNLRHMRTCKEKKKKDLQKEDEKELKLKKCEEQLEILREEILDLKDQKKDYIIQNKKGKKKISELQNKIYELENPEENEENEQNIEDKSKYVNKELFSNKKKKIPLTLRYKIWLNKYGESFNGDCYCCSKEINITNFHCGHIISRKDNGPINENNLRPICQTCNSSMGSQNMEEFKSKFFHI